MSSIIIQDALYILSLMTINFNRMLITAKNAFETAINSNYPQIKSQKKAPCVVYTAPLKKVEVRNKKLIIFSQESLRINV